MSYVPLAVCVMIAFVVVMMRFGQWQNSFRLQLFVQFLSTANCVADNYAVVVVEAHVQYLCLEGYLSICLCSYASLPFGRIAGTAVRAFS